MVSRKHIMVSKGLSFELESFNDEIRIMNIMII